jgi:copper oxidase (laccase) domain-containing protein
MRFQQGVANPRRSSFFASLGLEASAVLGAELHHTRRVLFSGAGSELLFGPPAEEDWHDGILVEGGGRAACVTVADCMPIWLLDTSSGIYGVLHSGWAGTGILAVAVEALAELRATPPGAISAILGPAIGVCCYAVPAERASAFEAEFGPGAVQSRDGRHWIDLRATNIALARRLGLGALLSIEACTSCEGGLGSYRRQGPASFTRMAALCAPSFAGP